MIQEFVREMSAEERSSLERAIRFEPPGNWRYTLRAIGRGARWLGLSGALLLMIGLAAAPLVSGGITVALSAVGLFMLYDFITALAEQRRLRRRRESFAPQALRKLARILEDGRVTVKRVRALAVVEIQPIEDEGMGYVFDLGDGRVLFLKGQDFDTPDDEAPWPNTEFEIVRTVVEGRMLGLHCHGTALPPLRVIPAADVDPQKGWDEREEVLHMTMDEAVRTVLREP